MTTLEDRKKLLNNLSVYQLKAILRAHNHHYYEKIKVPKSTLIDEVFKFYVYSLKNNQLIRKVDQFKPSIVEHVPRIRKPKVVAEKQKKVIPRQQLLLMPPPIELEQQPVIFEPRRQQVEGTTQLQQAMNELGQLKLKLSRMHFPNRMGKKGEKLRQKIEMLERQVDFLIQH
jgi:hypothetical protein